MDKKPKKKSAEAMIAEISAKVDKLCDKVMPKRNYYRAMEDALRQYPVLKREIVDVPEEYGFFPAGKSKDISVAPPKGSGVTDKVEINELYVQSRKNSLLRTLEQFAAIDTVIRMFEHRREFVVIRLVYLNQDINGNDRGVNAPKYTWEQIAEEIDKLDGPVRSLSTIRAWRSSLVREMAVMMWPEAAGTLDNYRRRNAPDDKGGERHDEEAERHGEVCTEDAGQ